MEPSTFTAVLCLGTGLGCLALALARVGDRTTQLTHAVMGAAMAAMVSPWGDPVPAGIGAAGFAVLGAWFAATALRGRGAPARHLTVCCAAMVFMYLVHGHHAAGAPGSGPHAGHMMSGGAALAAMPVALLLAGYFVWHTWTCVDTARCSTGPAAGTTRVRSAVRLEPVAHGAMSVLMAAMFLGAV